MKHRNYDIRPAFDMENGHISESYFIVIRPNGSFACAFDTQTNAKKYIDNELKTIEEYFGKEIFKRYIEIIKIKFLTAA